MDGLSPWSYRAGKSPIHTMGAALKLALLFGLSILAFFGGVWAQLGAAAIIALGSALANMSPRRLFSGASGPFIITISIVLLGAVTLNDSLKSGYSALEGFPLALDPSALKRGLSLLFAVMTAFAAGSILFATTTNAGLREALSRMERAAVRPIAHSLEAFRLKRTAAAIRASDISLVIALSLGFLPRIFEVWETADEAWRARGGKPGIRGTITILPLVLERLLEGAAETASALEARGYRGYSTDTKPH